MFKKRKNNEREIVEGCVRNERKSQELLYREHFDTMMRMCMRYTNDRDKAMEIVNVGFLKVFQKIHTFQFKGSLEGWIRRLVFHCLSDYYRKNSKYLQFMVFEERDQSSLEKAHSNLYAEDILKMVNTLPPATQEVFRLYAIEGFTHLEISKNVGISVGTSKWHLSNARKILKKLIDQNNLRQYAG
ncbi:MAG: RNA polymerase sigma factor [Saprospiraceae bacterium]|nr:RNA polymerase sigma factor [bacterium]MDC3253825.1 RNA polymerase sigma factor [bacterium]MDG1436057.1 RNA polymerase sigma factor [Saprospiraceae bacterium]MDG2417528.1 RNA polymerase sigma factor [Saprospiraceae bacterium]